MSWHRNNDMIEPIESESKIELNRFIVAVISIKNEINKIVNNEYCLENNIIKTLHML